MLTDFQTFLKQPFASNMPASQWFLFLGLLLIIMLMWHMIIQAFTNGASAFVANA